jgi:hypothetical protein
MGAGGDTIKEVQHDEQTEQFILKFQELDKAAPRIVVPRWVSYLFFRFIRPIAYGVLKLVYKKQYDPAPRGFQEYRAKMARLICQTFGLDETPEALIRSEKCDGPCNNHVYMLVRGKRSLCYKCWIDDLQCRIEYLQQAAETQGELTVRDCHSFVETKPEHFGG